MDNILGKIQLELKAPKSQFNAFGKYHYRNCEDILEAVKPILSKYDAYITIVDDIILIGVRYYVKATATIYAAGNPIGCGVAYARESEEKKGMDAAQVTGASSSYARKYALNGLLLIDDTKDADTDEKPKEEKKKVPRPPVDDTFVNPQTETPKAGITDPQRKKIFAMMKEKGIESAEGKKDFFDWVRPTNVGEGSAFIKKFHDLYNDWQDEKRTANV